MVNKCSIQTVIHHKSNVQEIIMRLQQKSLLSSTRERIYHTKALSDVMVAGLQFIFMLLVP